MSSATIGSAQNVVLFGASFPTITFGLKTNDTYMQTNDGTESGLVLAEYVFSLEANNWILTPGGSVSNPVSWTNVSW
jgi:hypothetical protein